MLFEHKCVLAVCVHIHPIMIKFHPVLFFFFFFNYDHFLRSGCCSSAQAPPTIDTGVLSQLRPEWAVISPPLFRLQSRGRRGWLLSDWGALLLNVIMNIAVWEGNVCFWRECTSRSTLKENATVFPYSNMFFPQLRRVDMYLSHLSPCN